MSPSVSWGRPFPLCSLKKVVVIFGCYRSCCKLQCCFFVYCCLWATCEKKKKCRVVFLMNFVDGATFTPPLLVSWPWVNTLSLAALFVPCHRYSPTQFQMDSLCQCQYCSKGPSTLATLFNHMWPRIVAGIFIPVGNHYYASPSSGEAYRDRRLTTNFELWVEIFCVPTCFHMRIPKPCLSVCPSVRLSVRLSVRTPRKDIIIASSISVLH